MARLKDDAQWIVLMGFLVSFSLFFLATVINQSTVIGQTTAESVSEFPKNDIRGVREVIVDHTYLDTTGGVNSAKNNVYWDIKKLALSRQNTVVECSDSTIGAGSSSMTVGEILYDNGVTVYKETWTANV